MSCFIYAETCDPPVDFWKYYKAGGNTGDVIECSINDVECKIMSKKIGNGFYVRIDNKIYIITCLHIIGHNNVKIRSYRFDAVTQSGVYTTLSVVKIIEEFDLVILGIENDMTIPPHMPDCSGSCDLVGSSCQIVSYVKNNNNIEQSQLNVVCEGVEHIKFITKLIGGYELPFLNLRPTELRSDVQGLSGSVVMSDGGPVAMVMLFDGKLGVIQALPFSIVMNVVKAYLRGNTLSILIMNTELVVDQESDGTVNFYGHRVVENFGIGYQGAGMKKVVIEEGDIVVGVNGNQVNERGCIACRRLGLEFKLKTYTMLWFLFEKFVEIRILRGIGDEIVRNVGGVDPCRYLSYNFGRQKTFLYHDGCVFIELAEDTLEYFRSNGVNFDLTGVVNGRGKQKKHVAIVYIDETKTGNTDLTAVKGKFDRGELIILSRIGNDEVVNLEILKKILNKKMGDRTVTFFYT